MLPVDYHIKDVSKPDLILVEKVFNLVWRVHFDAPGFALLDLGSAVDSHELRSWMVELKVLMSEICFERSGKRFRYRSMGRFDQQVTTKFHLDGAPAESLLMLGYEPSNVQSRLFLADYSRAAFDLGISPEQFLEQYNPMYKKGEELLIGYTTELPQPDKDHALILLVNNSYLPYNGSDHPLGVMHKAIIVVPDETLQRIVNSTMLVVEGEELDVDKQRAFMDTNDISQKIY